MFAAHSARDLFGKENCFNTVSSSRPTITWQVEDISNILFNQLRNKAKEFGSFCWALVENNDSRDAADVLTVIRVTTESFEVV